MATTSPNPRRRSSVVDSSTGRRSSIIALENAALDVHAAPHNIRLSISGRLGGSIRNDMAAVELALAELGEEEVSEETLLLFGVEPSPPLMVWIFPALTCAAAYAFYNIFIKKGSFTIHPILGGVVLQFVAALLGTVLMGAIILKGDNKGEIEYDRSGLIWSCCAGLAVGTAEMLSFCVSGMGVNATQSIPIVSNTRRKER